VFLLARLRRFLAWKRCLGQSLGPDASLFVSSQRRRFSPLSWPVAIRVVAAAGGV
jgi:hypothetical protein